MIELEDLKSYLDLDTNDDDETLTVLIEAVKEYLQNKIGSYIEETSVTEYLNGDDIKDKIFLSHSVISLTSLHYNTGTYASPIWNAFNANYYTTDTDKGIIYCDTMYSGIRNIKVVYKAGYATIPYSLKTAALKLVSKLYNKRRSDGFKEEEVAGARINWDELYSSDIAGLVDPYRKFNI